LFFPPPGVLKQVTDECVVGASVCTICRFGDDLLIEETSKVSEKEEDLDAGEPSILIDSYVTVYCVQ
jgi:methionine aminopeptidase